MIANTPFGEAIAQQLNLREPIDLERLPATMRNALPSDPAREWPGAPPFFGEDLVPHIFTTSGYVGSAAKAYPIEDECTRNSWENAERMRTEPAIRECIEARQRAVAGLKWHLQPEDENNPRERALCTELTKIINRTPLFLDLKMWLLEALWLGRSAVFQNYGVRRVGDQRYITVAGWEPRHGDKLIFRYSDGTPDYQKGQLGIRIHAAYPSRGKIASGLGKQIEATQYGLVRWFDNDERETVTVHRHMIEDGPFRDPRALGRINGVGIRDRIYHTWMAAVAVEVDLLTFLGRAAMGVRLWRYPSGNPKWKDSVDSAAKRTQQGGYADILYPVEPNEYSHLYGVEQIEPGLAGASMLSDLLRTYFFHKIKRYILGQTSTSETASSGLGSGIAEAHLQTFADIVTYDAVKLSETMTTDFVPTLIRKNFPDMEGAFIRFVLSTENADAQRLIQLYQAAWSMGAGLCEDDIYSVLGAKMPTDTDKVLKNPSVELGRQQVEMGRVQLEMMQSQQQAGAQQGPAGSAPAPAGEQPQQGQPAQASVAQETMPDSMAATHRTIGPTVDVAAAAQMPTANPTTESTNPLAQSQPQSDTMRLIAGLVTPRWLKAVKQEIEALPI